MSSKCIFVDYLHNELNLLSCFNVLCFFYWQTLEECETLGTPTTEQSRNELEFRIEEAKEKIRKAEVCVCVCVCVRLYLQNNNITSKLTCAFLVLLLIINLYQYLSFSSFILIFLMCDLFLNVCSPENQSHTESEIFLRMFHVDLCFLVNTLSTKCLAKKSV